MIRIATNALFALLLLTHGALAADTKTLPGLTCVGVDGTPDTSNGAAYNDSTSATLTVRCPILRDEPSTLTALSTSMYVLDTTPSGSVSCTFYAMKSTSASGSSSTSSTSSSGYSSTPTTITFTGSGYSSGYNYVKCSIPAVYASTNQSAVVSVVYAE